MERHASFLDREAVVGLLELLASERPDLLGPVFEALKYSPASPGLAQVAELWSIRPEDRAADLEAVAVRASSHLDRLERRRPGTWRHPGQVVDGPNIAALVSLASARHGRVEGMARGKRLNVIRRKLKRAAAVERQRRQLDAFLREKPSQPVDVAAFMGWSGDHE